MEVRNDVLHYMELIMKNKERTKELLSEYALRYYI
jgi:hypothetical protein